MPEGSSPALLAVLSAARYAMLKGFRGLLSELCAEFSIGAPSYAAAVFGGSISPTMYKACAGAAPPPHTAKIVGA